MAENIPNIPGAPQGAIPPKKETGKVQPKKETVRISLPPKPTAAPTIKLPALPPGGPAAATGGGKPAPVFSTGAPKAGAPGAPALAIKEQPTSSAAAPATRRPMPAATAARPVSGLDSNLAIGAAVAGLAAIGSVLYLWLGIVS